MEERRQHDKDIERVIEVISEHAKDDKEYQDATKTDMSEIRGDIRIIKENHLSHIEKAIERISTDMEWMKKTYWIVATATVGGLIVGLFNAIIK